MATKAQRLANGKLPKSIREIAELTGMTEAEVRYFPCLAELRKLIDEFNHSSKKNAKEILIDGINSLKINCNKQHQVIYNTGIQAFLAAVSVL